MPQNEAPQVRDRLVLVNQKFLPQILATKCHNCQKHESTFDDEQADDGDQKEDAELETSAVEKTKKVRLKWCSLCRQATYCSAVSSELFPPAAFAVASVET